MTQPPGAIGRPPFVGPEQPQQGASGSPGAAPEPAQRAAPPRPPVATTDPTLNGLVPKAWVDQGKTASDFRDLLAGIASNRFVSPNAKDAALARIKAIDEYLGKTGEQAQAATLPTDAAEQAGRIARKLVELWS